MGKGIAIVTGGANGIGRAIVDRLIQDGFGVIAADLDKDAGNSLLSAHPGASLEFYLLDITNAEQVQLFFNHCVKKYSKVDVLVNNAGIIRDHMIWKMTEEEFDAVINVNLKGTWLMCRAAAALMKEQGAGRIINIASRAWLGNLGQSNYSASKAGVVALSRVLALELGKYNVLVNTVAPGLIDTPLTQSLPADVREKLIKAQPSQQIGSPKDVANAVSFFASPKTVFITGQLMYVDGGKSVGAG